MEVEGGQFGFADDTGPLKADLQLPTRTSGLRWSSSKGRVIGPQDFFLFAQVLKEVVPQVSFPLLLQHFPQEVFVLFYELLDLFRRHTVMREAAVVATFTNPSAVQHLARNGLSSAHIVLSRSGRHKRLGFFLLGGQFVQKGTFFSLKTPSLREVLAAFEWLGEGVWQGSWAFKSGVHRRLLLLLD